MITNEYIKTTIPLIVTFLLYQFWPLAWFNSIPLRVIRKYWGFLMISRGTEGKYWVEKVYITITFCMMYFFRCTDVIYLSYYKITKCLKFTAFLFFSCPRDLLIHQSLVFNFLHKKVGIFICWVKTIVTRSNLKQKNRYC